MNSQNLKKLINDFKENEKNNTENLIKGLIEEKIIKYLDVQVEKEIEAKFSITCENKRDKNDFKNIIEKFLNNYFYYISQKYIIYKIVSDTGDSFSKEIVKEVNHFIKNFILKQANELFKKNFLKKFDNLRDLIKTYKKDDKIYDCKDNRVSQENKVDHDNKMDYDNRVSQENKVDHDNKVDYDNKVAHDNKVAQDDKVVRDNKVELDNNKQSEKEEQKNDKEEDKVLSISQKDLKYLENLENLEEAPHPS